MFFVQIPFRTLIKRNFVFSSLAFATLAQAATPGAYFYLGGGGAYLQNSKLGDTKITRVDIDLFRHIFSITYSQKSSFDFAGRAAFGYFFHQNPEDNHGFGIEAGYNYFTAVNSRINNQLIIPLINVSHGVYTTNKANTWSSDLFGIYRKTIGQSRGNILVKFGIGYEDMTNKISNIVAGLPNELQHHVTLEANGVGVAAGVGFEFDFSKHVGMRFEIDGLKGGKGIGYGQGLIGLTLYT